MAKLQIITCSGANEFTSIEDMISLSKRYSIIEWGIQVSGKKCSMETPRFEWIKRLRQYLLADHLKIQLALHVNADWVEGFCTQRVSPELNTLLRMKYDQGEPLFGRIQLNFKIGREKTPDKALLMMRLKEYGQNRRFILSYNEANTAFIHLLYKEGLRNFDVLFDSSHGEGMLAKKWQEPAFFDDNIFQGYAGGLSPENISAEILKMNKVVPYNRSFYIDAEGKLKGENKHLSLEKCEQYVINALKAMNV